MLGVVSVAKFEKQGDYKLCYVAFLDILGFKQLISRSEREASIFQRLSRLPTVSAQLNSGMKATTNGPCPIQIRSFSDCVVVFTPTRPGKAFAPNGLAQLLFVVRFIHDEVLKLDACLRGGVVIGKMYWHPTWTNEPATPNEMPLPLTFGPGLVGAYELESKKAKVPRVIVDSKLRRNSEGSDAHPFASHGKICSYLRKDADGEYYLDLLNRNVTRSTDEMTCVTANGFTITWSEKDNRFETTLELARNLADKGISENAADACVRGKYQWLLDYTTAAKNSLCVSSPPIQMEE